MISDFEAHLASVLGAQLPSPFAGTVNVAGDADNAHGSQPRVYVGVYKSAAKPQGFGGNRTLRVPGVDDPVRVLAAKVWVNINVLAAQNAGRTQQLQGIEQIHYLLDEESFQTGAALVDTGDQGFVIERMQVHDALVTVEESPEGERPPGITLEAEGVFWPIGATGETGVVISEIRMRGLLMGIELGAELPVFTAGDTAVDIQLQVDFTAAHRLGGDGSPLTFDTLAADLQQPDGSAGAGTLSGDAAGTGTVQLVNIADNTVTLSYTPPASPATDELLVGFEDGESGLGQVIKRFTLETR